MLRLLTLTGLMLAAPALAENAVVTLGQDRYQAGSTVRFDGPTVDDLFIAANRLTVAAPVEGSAHLAGRRVTVDAAVAGDLFAAGYDVTATGAVGGDASVTGYEVTLGDVTGNLRAAGAEIKVGAVGGYALITGAEVAIRGAIAGDAVLVVDRVSFGPGASVAGTLTIYAEDPASITVPDSVAPAARVSIAPRKSHDMGAGDHRMPVRVSFWSIATGYLMGVLVSGLVAALVIAVAPKAARDLRELALAHPGRAIWSGFLVTSALAGSGFVLMLTVVGVILLPVMLILTGCAILAGYALGSYVLGVGLWLAAGRAMPDGVPGKFGLACLGAAVAGAAWAVPVAGWFFVLVLTLLGIGTLAAFVLPGNLLLRRAEVMS